MSNSDVVWHHAMVTRSLRNQHNHHKSVVLWFTGLSGAGKSTLSHAVEEKLYLKGCRTFVLDGDNIRHGLNSDLSFSDKDRGENIRRVGEVAKLMMEAGLITLAAFISPFRLDREYVRNLMPHGDFIEIYCRASIECCEMRDVKGLYSRARSGGVINYTGIDSPYEEPVNPELIIDTEQIALEESTQLVMKMLDERVIFS